MAAITPRNIHEQLDCLCDEARWLHVKAENRNVGVVEAMDQIESIAERATKLFASREPLDPQQKYSVESQVKQVRKVIVERAGREYNQALSFQKDVNSDAAKSAVAKAYSIYERARTNCSKEL
ncbi:MAG: hypothetical protein K1X28_06675 [Parachlamydiales bacterium]|nr:hypothetical protein [Parachlamydiales bacterium]